MNDAAGSRTPEEAAGSRTPEEEALAGEIERTREQLGETVEALAAKADVKGRAQHRVAEVTGNLRGKARAAKDKVTGQAVELRDEAAAKAARAKDNGQATAARATDTAQATSTPVRQQVTAGAAGAARAVRGVTPAPVQRSVGQAVAIVRTNRGKVASASLAALVVLAWLALRRRR